MCTDKIVDGFVFLGYWAMASLEKLVKALEVLKVFQPGAPADEAK